MSFSEVTDLLKSLNAKRVVLLCHHNADPDAICSAYACASLLKAVNQEITTEIIAANGISKLSKHLLNHLPIDVKMFTSLEETDVVILVDTNTVQQLDTLAEKITEIDKPVIVIDHHAIHPETRKIARICLTVEDASSTCEMVYGFYRQMNLKPGAVEARALFLGIAFDTRHFVLANSSTLKAVADLTDSGVNAQENLALLSLPMDFSERVARLKATRRTRIFKIEKWIIALSHVSAYQASAARALIELGAHVAVVAGEKNQAIEISLRSTMDFNKSTGIHLGKDVAKPLGEYLHGMGGGHAMAAGVNGVGDIEIGLKRCLSLLRQILIKLDRTKPE